MAKYFQSNQSLRKVDHNRVGIATKKQIKEQLLLIFRCFRPSCGAIQSDVSLLPLGLCVVGKLGRKKKTAFGARWERGREKRVLCHMMCGSVVLAKPADYLDAFERCCEDNSIKGVSILFHGFFTIHVLGAVVRHLAPFPSSHLPLRAFYFFDYFYSYRDTQREPLRRREI